MVESTFRAGHSHTSAIKRASCPRSSTELPQCLSIIVADSFALIADTIHFKQHFWP